MGDRTAFIIHFDTNIPNSLHEIMDAWKDNPPRSVDLELAGVGLIIGWDKGSYPGFFTEISSKLPTWCTWVSMQEDGWIERFEPVDFSVGDALSRPPQVNEALLEAFRKNKDLFDKDHA